MNFTIPNDIHDLSSVLKNRTLDFSKDWINQLMYGYGCSKNIEEKIAKATLYQDVLDRAKQQLHLGTSLYLNDERYQCLKEKIKDITGKNCKAIFSDLEVDDSGKDAWIASNPRCVSYEDWERWVYAICEDIDLQLTTIREACNFIFEVTREIIPCDVLFVISVQKEACNLGLSITRTDQECELDFKLLHEKVPSCDLDFKAYRTLVDCNYSFDIVRTVYECGLSFDVNTSAGDQACTVTLVSDLGEYCVDSMQGNINIDPLKKFGLKTKLNKKDLLQDYGS